MVVSVVEFQNCLQQHATATAALVSWCRARYPGRAETLSATVLQDGPADPRHYDGALNLLPDDVLFCRRVRLQWGDLVMSEAENWYLPKRLPETMRSALKRSNRPFGAVVAPLAPLRTTIAMLTGAELRGEGELATRLRAQISRAGVFSAPEAFALHVTAVMTAAGVELAELREHYRRELLEAPGYSVTNSERL